MARSLIDKLGWKPGTASQVWRVPVALEEALAPLLSAPADPPAFRIAFAHNRAELAEAARKVAAAYTAGGHLWLCYPKKSGSIPTDLTRDLGWEPIVALGLLPVTQVALDADWSALRFRLRGEIAKLTRQSEVAAKG